MDYDRPFFGRWSVVHSLDDARLSRLDNASSSRSGRSVDRSGQSVDRSGRQSSFLDDDRLPEVVDLWTKSSQPSSEKVVAFQGGKVAYSAKIAKKKESCAHAYDKGLSANNLPATLSVSSNDVFSPTSDRPTFKTFSTPNSSFIIIPASDSAVLAPRITDVSPSKSVGNSVSLDETVLLYADNSYAMDVANMEFDIAGSLVREIYEERLNRLMILLILIALSRIPNFQYDKHSQIIDLSNGEVCEIWSDSSGMVAIFCIQVIKSSNFQAKKRPVMDFLERVQKGINATMRAILIDWLVEVLRMESVVLNFLKFEMTVLTANCFLRRFVHAPQGAIQKNQANKETATSQILKEPEAKSMQQILGTTMSPEDEVAPHEWLTKATRLLLDYTFLGSGGAQLQVLSLQLECLANYMVELSILVYNMLKYAPTLAAAPATFLANFILFRSKKPWNSTLGHYTL
ncbi:cyclin-A1-1-like [Mangifera indica]|uniref:cyclin-A1-1-like n=1 Tax=Mangifera indica TaxID=29780 RepID=UPI001CFB42A2|nr:cyclin-A1-1-like [Mangifera indica]